MNSVQVNEIQTKLEKAIAKIAKEYGLSPVQIDVRRFTRDQGIRIMKIDLMRGSVNQSNTDTLADAMRIYGIKNRLNKRGEKLIGYNPRAKRYPFVYQGVKGGRWKITADSAKVKFG